MVAEHRAQIKTLRAKCPPGATKSTGAVAVIDLLVESTTTQWRVNHFTVEFLIFQDLDHLAGNGIALAVKREFSFQLALRRVIGVIRNERR